ncbi:hypothetical protein B0J13DRAFT_532236 [Dactylonectria estremocensis]|uniref:Uncharacterized protein n=1 Tax=Dactylonectria estremocensis TaxID=1079267 RepID=A0A9P9IFU4_9HYPO|nr:hypothetical protein B0J13DRAFT_532236 [Dactylonectria estremocensis]
MSSHQYDEQRPTSQSSFTLRIILAVRSKAMSTLAQDASTTRSPASDPTQSAPPVPDPAVMMQIFVMRAKNEYDAMKFYTAISASLIELFIISHISFLTERTYGLQQYTAVVQPYLGLNVSVIFVYVDDSVLQLHAVVSARTGWLAIANICFTVPEFEEYSTGLLVWVVLRTIKHTSPSVRFHVVYSPSRPRRHILFPLP